MPATPSDEVSDVDVLADMPGSLDLRIPFGLSLSQERLLDVTEVSRGAACDCICPCCKVPLIAKHGEAKRWHFAHGTRGNYKTLVDLYRPRLGEKDSEFAAEPFAWVRSLICINVPI